jgi:cytochrome P450 family 619
MDETRFESPEKFIPERYASYPELAPHYAATGDWEKRDHFGYGASRRICPGIHVAERNLFIAISKLLWAFEFTKDENGVNDVSAETGSSQGFMHCVKDYNAGIRLRGEGKRAAILRELEEAQQVFARFD